MADSVKELKWEVHVERYYNVKWRITHFICRFYKTSQKIPKYVSF